MKHAVILVIAMLAGTGVGFAQDARSLISEKMAIHKDICPAVQAAISGKMQVAPVVTAAIQMGHGACTVVRCSIQGGAPLEQVVFGAVAAGATADVISKCCLEAGAQPADVAAVMAREEFAGLGPTPPGGAPAAIGFPERGRNSGLYISPSRF